MVNAWLQKDVEALCSRSGFTPVNARVMSAIAMVEAPYSTGGKSYSDFDRIGDQALANEKWGFSYSGFQVRSLKVQTGTGLYRDALKLPDPEFAAKSSYKIWTQSGFAPWSTFMTGQYKAFMQDVFPPPQGVYMVMPGDTLSGIALKLKIGAWQDLARVNGLRSPYTIFIGQALLLPWFEYTVKAGDTLSFIVTTYGEGVTVPQVQEFNNIVDPNKISIDQIIRIPRSTL